MCAEGCKQARKEKEGRGKRGILLQFFKKLQNKYYEIVQGIQSNLNQFVNMHLVLNLYKMKFFVLRAGLESLKGLIHLHSNLFCGI